MLQGRNLSLGYDGNIVAKNINFSLQENDYFCVIGENGSGKSTLMKTILGFQKPISGDLIYDDDFDKRKIGYLAQQTTFQSDFPATVFEIVISGFESSLNNRFFYNKIEKQIALEKLKYLGIDEYRNTSFNKLSGGQRQRVLLARALCSAEKLLILDEPLTGLDPKVSHQLYELINDLNKNGMTIFMISHDISMAVKYANKILHLGDSNFYGSKDEYLNSNFFNNFIVGKLTI